VPDFLDGMMTIPVVFRNRRPHAVFFDPWPKPFKTQRQTGASRLSVFQQLFTGFERIVKLCGAAKNLLNRWTPIGWRFEILRTQGYI
jgi:hypothetical protein